MLHKLRNEMGLSARVIEARRRRGRDLVLEPLPGRPQSDSDSYVYGFMFDEELWQDWEWTERYPEHAEIRAYLEHVAERYDLPRDIRFDTPVSPAHLR